jgi:hypothetical protein
MSQQYVTRGFMGAMGVLIAMFVHGTVLHADTKPPEGAVKAELGFPPVGTTWVMKIRASVPLSDEDTKRTAQEGTVFTKTFTAMEESTHGGRPVYRVRDGSKIHLIDKATRNLTAYVREHKEFTYDKAKDDVVVTSSEGEELLSFSPYAGVYNFPLWVGKSWVTPHTLKNHKQGTTTKLVWQGEVIAYEDVTVPTGTFKTFKIEGSNGITRTVLWYSPKLNINVKAILDAKRSSELIEYVAK